MAWKLSEELGEQVQRVWWSKSIGARKDVVYIIIFGVLAGVIALRIFG